ncbi:hypothetical protein Leryth_013123 [Lithospermum erythrorhizon]|nr:hypothetical protein Leryth_013123 [Lithospermum erythrorhizon]
MSKFTPNSILPSENPLIVSFINSSLTSSSILRRKPPVLAGLRRPTRRKLPPKVNKDKDMSVSVDISDSEPFLDSRTRRNGLQHATVEEGSYSPSKSYSRRNRSFFSSISCFGVELTPDNIAVAMVYFVQGVLGLSRLAVSFYLKDDLHLDPAETAVISGFSSLPWLVKPLYGFISDSFPLFGYRRRSYLVLSGLLGALSWSLMATMVDSKYSAAFCILLGSLSVAFSDVYSEKQSYMVFKIFEDWSESLSFASPGFFESSKKDIIQIWGTIKQPNVFLPTLFIFLWQATPQSDPAMFYFTTNKLHFSPEFMGRVKLVTSVASLIGVGLYNGFLKAVPLRKIFLATTLFGTALGMTQIFLVTGFNRQFGISDQWFAIGDSLILTVLGQASFMPVLVLAARLCPEGMEATLFATLMSISNGGSVLGGLIGAGLTQVFGVTKDRFDNLILLIVVCNLTSLLPLPLLGLLPKDNTTALPKDRTDVETKSG